MNQRSKILPLLLILSSCFSEVGPEPLPTPTPRPPTPHRYCGDGICDTAFEDPWWCPEDCYISYCGDGWCEYPETKLNCWRDCKPKIRIDSPEQINPEFQVIDPPGD